jgi:hypothetical protein
MTTTELLFRILNNLIIGILLIGILYEGWKAVNTNNILDPDRQVPVKKGGLNLFFISGVSYLLLMAFIIVVPTQTITENIEVSYTEKETYYTQEPYTTQEPYQVQETYQTQEAYQTTGYQVNSESSFKKIDAPSGSHFEVDIDDITRDGCECSGWTNDFSHDPFTVCVQKKCPVSDSGIGGNTGINYRTVTKTRTVTKYHTVTQYKDVPKTRDVTKTRIEPREAEVSRVFGFKTPYTFHL